MVAMADVLVTGSEGFIGNALARALVRSNHTVRGIDLREPGSPKLEYEYIQGDVENSSDVEGATRHVEVIYHFAAMSNLNNSRGLPLQTIESNVMATSILCDICLRKGIKMIFASSEHVYGTSRRRTINETTPMSPNEIYAASKAAGEYIIRNFGIRNTILRLSTAYGPRMREALAIYLFLSRAIKGETISIHSPGTQRRQYIYVDDIASACIAAMREEGDGKVFNVPGPELISVIELAKTCIELAESKSELTFLSSRKGDIDSGFLSYDKARKFLQWEPKIGLRKGLQLTLEWIKANQTKQIPTPRVS